MKDGSTLRRTKETQRFFNDVRPLRVDTGLVATPTPAVIDTKAAVPEPVKIPEPVKTSDDVTGRSMTELGTPQTLLITK